MDQLTSWINDYYNRGLIGLASPNVAHGGYVYSG